MKIFSFYMALIAGLVLTGSALANDEYGSWHLDKVQGFDKYWTESREGDRFTIWCNKNRSVAGTVIDIDIGGFSAPPGRNVRVIFGRGTMMRLAADSKGYIQTNCAACADAFKVLWNRMRRGGHVAVKFDDERYALFSLKGAGKVLSADMCKADFEKTASR